MYENEYDDYMRSLLGYPTSYINNSFPYRDNADIEVYERLYPDIYRMLKPMVNKVCEKYRNNSITGEILDEMATEIYNNIESDINVIDITSQELDGNQARNIPKGNTKVQTSTDDEKLKRGCCGNHTLKDLIKILLINQLIQNSHNKPPRPPRPPFNPYPPRPPMPPRPPYRDVENSGYYDNYYNMNNL